MGFIENTAMRHRWGRERTPWSSRKKQTSTSLLLQLKLSVGTDCTFGPTHTDRERPTRRQSTLCSPSRGRSALPQMVSSSQGGCSRLTHACIQAQTHVHACVHARVALASFAHGECSPCIQPHTRASKRRHACMRTCVHARMRHHGELCPWRAL